jgi:hypothetical protein
MTRLAVRAFLATTLQNVAGLVVYDAEPKSSPVADQAIIRAITAKERRDTQDTKRVSHTATVLLQLIDPEAEEGVKTLDGWIDAVLHECRAVGVNQTLTDPNTGEESYLLWMAQSPVVRKPVAVDMGPAIGEEGDLYTSVLVDIDVEESVPL